MSKASNDINGTKAGVVRKKTNPTFFVRKTPWPFSTEDLSPIFWWRHLPSDLLGDAEALTVRATLDKIQLMSSNREFGNALSGEAAAAIAVALAIMPIESVSFEVDLVMTAVLRVATEGNAAASLVLSHVLTRAKLNHAHAMELSASWITHHLCHTTNRHRFTDDEAEVWNLLRKQDAVEEKRP